MVFYRKHRPQKFASVVGQEHIKKTLINSLIQGNFSHCYLFAGPRGSGKTTMARIFAKALNCTGRKLKKDSFEPCNKCSSCQDINNGKSLDIIEIDAASNRGIDEVRELREKIRFTPTSSNYKIYIIDEVHMLTKEAFNALLKTLEEPPKHAIFIMATTEPHKVLPTILSRVQRFDFHKATIEEISFLIKRVAKLENLKIDDEVVKLLAQLSFGAYRDALSLLDQISSLRQRNVVSLKDAQEVLGLAQEKSVFDFIDKFSQKDRKGLLDLVNKLYFQGVDLENFTISLIDILRKIVLFKMGQDQTFDLTHEQQAQVKAQAANFTEEELMDMIAKFVGSLSQLKNSNIPTLPLEMLIFELTGQTQNSKFPLGMQTQKHATDNEKSKISEPSILKANRGGETHGQGRAERLDPISSLGKSRSVSLMDTGERKGQNFSKDLWPEVIKAAKAHNNNLAAMLSHAVIASAAEENITLAFKFKFHANMVSGRHNTKIIEDIIEKICGSRYILSCVVDPEQVLEAPKDDETELLEGVTEVFEVEE